MTPQRAVTLVFSQIFVYSGRATRPEYWWWVLVFATAQATLLFICIALICLARPPSSPSSLDCLCAFQ